MPTPVFVAPEVSSAHWGLYELLGERLYEAVAGLGRARWAANRLRSTRYTPPVRRALAGSQPLATNTHPDR